MCPHCNAVLANNLMGINSHIRNKHKDKFPERSTIEAERIKNEFDHKRNSG